MSFERKFWSLINEFTDLQQKKEKAPEKPRHRGVTTGQTRLHQNMVADRYKKRLLGNDEFQYRGELNSKVEAIRSGHSTREVLTKADENYILKNYPIDELDKNKPKKLFDVAEVAWDHMLDSYILRRV